MLDGKSLSLSSLRHRVGTSYQAQTESEMSLMQGEPVLLHRHRPDGRVLLTQESSGHTGLFHSSVLQFLDRFSWRPVVFSFYMCVFHIEIEWLEWGKLLRPWQFDMQPHHITLTWKGMSILEILFLWISTLWHCQTRCQICGRVCMCILCVLKIMYYITAI